MERSQDLAFHAEASDALLRFQVPRQELNGHFVREGPIGAPGAVDDAHPAVSDALGKPVRPDLLILVKGGGRSQRQHGGKVINPCIHERGRLAVRCQ